MARPKPKSQNLCQEALLDAIKSMDIELARQAVASGADPRLPHPETLRTPLIEALFSYDKDIVAFLLPLSDPDAQDSDGDSALTVASFLGLSEAVETLLPFSNPNISNHARYTPLIAAAQIGDAESVRALLPHSSPNERNHLGETALFCAASMGHADCLRILIPASDCNQACGSKLNTALIEAAATGKDACVELLMPATDHRIQNKQGITALDGAVAYENKQCAKLIRAYIQAQNERIDLNNSVSEPASATAKRSKL